MSDLHITVDLPPDATDEQVTDLRAKAFEMALRHAATDPGIRAKMLAGEANAMIRMIPVDSSHIVAIGYSPETKTLRVQFKDGSLHDRADTTPEEFSRFMAAPSYGGHFNQHFRGKTVRAPQQDEAGSDESDGNAATFRPSRQEDSLEAAVERFRGE